MRCAVTFVYPRHANRRRGMTLVETMVSIGIFSFITSFVSFLVFMGSINAYNVHDQVLAQNAAAAAAERLTSVLREASAFQLYPGDSIDTSSDLETTLTRIQFTVPPVGNSFGTQRTSLVRFQPATTRNGLGKIQYFANASDAASGGQPTISFPNISSLVITYDSEFRLHLDIGYRYRGFALVLNDPGNPQIGLFSSTVIAKNHFLPYGPNGYRDAYDASITTSVVHL